MDDEAAESPEEIKTDRWIAHLVGGPADGQRWEITAVDAEGHCPGWLQIPGVGTAKAWYQFQCVDEESNELRYRFAAKGRETSDFILG